jgi:hypothetical protein
VVCWPTVGADLNEAPASSRMWLQLKISFEYRIEEFRRVELIT